MLAATFAKRIGKTVAFALAAFRQAFAGGHALSEPDNVLIAGAACEMHPARSCGRRDARACARSSSARAPRAAALGVDDVPAVRVGDARAGRRGASSSEAGALLAAARA